jgi:hypothetical protein
MNNLENKLKGEKSFAEKALLILPLIKKHFEDFDGVKAINKTGESAKFKKVSKEFSDDVNELFNDNAFRCYVSNSTYSVYIKADVRVSNPSGSCTYYGKDIYIGDIDGGAYGREATGIFKYKFNEEPIKENLLSILATTLESLEAKKAKIAKLKDEIDEIENSVTYSLKSALS